MGFETIVLVEGEQLDSLLSILADAATRPGLIRSLRFAIDDGIKIKFNSETWSPPYGEIEERPGGTACTCTCPPGPEEAHLNDCQMYSPHVDNIERR